MFEILPMTKPQILNLKTSGLSPLIKALGARSSGA